MTEYQVSESISNTEVPKDQYAEASAYREVPVIRARDDGKT